MKIASFFLWGVLSFLCLSGAMMLSVSGAQIASLETGLGPVVEVSPL
ncbi:MAG: hypothetical protein OIF48_13165 [Silicimonas sp.]|nr:hypothetical protein [Silicimonas sp.]